MLSALTRVDGSQMDPGAITFLARLVVPGGDDQNFRASRCSRS